MPELSQSENAFVPRPGQQELIELLPSIKEGECHSVQWPTGYGKSIGFALAWKHFHERGMVNRLLMIVANDVQREQIKNDFEGDCKLVGAPCGGGVYWWTRTGADIGVARKGEAVVFVCTVQQLEACMRGHNTIGDLLAIPGTSWMVGFDEYHHYGDGMAWGNAAKGPMEIAKVAIAMSATPHRRKVDTVFPEPSLVVTYADGVEQEALKPMICHAYDYTVTVIEDGKEPVNYTTAELWEGKGRGTMSEWEERRKIRYSSQYIQPLLITPLDRLMKQRAATGVRLQMLIRSMSCLHAKMVCEQARTFTEGLVVEWVGTGPNGRGDKENASIREGFCPPKVDGRRPDPSVDVLVQVSMAGEGFDSINVCEIVDLFPVSRMAENGRATQDKQFYGRGSRAVRDGFDNLLPIEVNVNVPTDHPLAKFANRNLHAWMDSDGGDLPDVVEGSEDDEIRERSDDDLFDFPGVPAVRFVRFNGIVTPEEIVEAGKKYAGMQNFHFDPSDPQHLETAKKVLIFAKEETAKDQSIKSRMIQMQDYLNAAVGRAAYILAKQSKEMSGPVIGRFKKEVNSMLIKKFGKRRDEMLPDDLERSAQFLLRFIESLKK